MIGIIFDFLPTIAEPRDVVVEGRRGNLDLGGDQGDPQNLCAWIFLEIIEKSAVWGIRSVVYLIKHQLKVSCTVTGKNCSSNACSIYLPILPIALFYLPKTAQLITLGEFRGRFSSQVMNKASTFWRNRLPLHQGCGGGYGQKQTWNWLNVTSLTL